MSKLAVIFPGIGYTCDKPLLYYGRAIAREAGYEECWNVSYAYQGGNVRGNAEKMKEAFEALYLQAEEDLRRVEWSKYGDVLFISKSIGTVIASAYAQKHGLSELPGVRHVLYTPVEQTFLFHPRNAVGFIGTADPWSDPMEDIRLAKAQGIPMHVYEGADHALETGDALANLDVIKEVMARTKEFVERSSGILADSDGKNGH